MRFSRFLLFLLLLLSAVFSVVEAGAAPKSKLRSILYSGRKWVNMRDVAKFYGLKFYAKGENIYLYSKYTKAVFHVKKRSGSFNNIAIIWFFTPVKHKNVYYMSEQDFSLIFAPLMRPKSLKKRPVRTIMIDAGHGGKDTGAIGINKKREKEITLAIAQKLRRKLRKLGYKVYLTRSGDTYPSLEQRVESWKKTVPKPDLFISIHCNSTNNQKVSGIETFSVTPVNAPSSADSKPDTKKYPGNAFDRNNTLLSYYVQRSLTRYFPYTPDRGMKHARFYVIRNVGCPAVLIETGFLSNWVECVRLSTDIYQDRIANAILSGILNYASVVR